VPTARSRPLRRTALLAILILVAAVAGYLDYRHVTLTTTGCEANGGGQAVTLDTDQAAIAATIAGVADARRLPAGAVTIAYATAMQESHMHNLDYGDLDSLGVFQQRPSQGWGTPRQITDPVYATGKFFAALVKVPHYLRIPLDQAAQDVQHSADGAAYANYQAQAAVMSGAFTGQRPHAVWCWYPGTAAGQSAQITPMRGQLLRTFGKLAVRPDGSPADAQVPVARVATGWTVASWMVTHAATYKISNVRYAGFQWNASNGSDGWTRDASASSGSVELR
jgi:hypothetical protein